MTKNMAFWNWVNIIAVCALDATRHLDHKTRATARGRSQHASLLGSSSELPLSCWEILLTFTILTGSDRSLTHASCHLHRVETTHLELNSAGGYQTGLQQVARTKLIWLTKKTKPGRHAAL